MAPFLAKHSSPLYPTHHRSHAILPSAQERRLSTQQQPNPAEDDD